ncbi:hypothetical protein ALP39_200205 [Pseudomonas marginalis pv. marginalis]|nr:hypothetical protein ALP39_200205 [Pseudomonas marginalis pv. marginalis]
MRLLKSDSYSVYKLEMWGGLVFKALAIACSFVLLPMMLSYLGGVAFGIWVAIFSIVSWVVFFDLGFGSGLRNKLSESLSANDFNESVTLISTAYAAMAALSSILFIVFFVANIFIDWQVLFSSNAVALSEFRFSMAVMMFLFLVNFTLLIVLQVLHASRKTFITVAHQFLANFTALVVMLFIREVFAPSLLVICTAYGLSQIVATLVVSFVFYKMTPHLRPGLKFIKINRVKEIATVGGQFFVIQLAVLVVFSTDKIIVVRLFGPVELSQYELIFKAYSAVLILSTLFLAPLWSRYTHAAASHNYSWMKKALLRSHLVCALLFAPALIFCVFGHDIIYVWSGYKIDPGFDLLVAMAVFVMLRVWCDIYAYFLNGVGVLKVQMWLAVVQALVNIPLSVMLGRMYGVPGVIYGSAITLSFSAILLPVSVFWYFKSKRRQLLIG